ncbi:sodium-dependent transporter, partial [bacterium]|nr:sodium-dependent transporter [bacterium]
IAWCVCYFFASFTLAWGPEPAKFFKSFIARSGSIYSEETGFTFGALNWWIVAALAFVWGVNWLIPFFGIKKGIERANKIFIPLLILLVMVLVGWSMTFEGASKGLKFYLTGDWAVLQNPEIWVQAFSQILFTLSLGFGIMIAYASYLPRESDIPTDALLTCVGNCFFSIFAGLAVFSTLGYIATKQGVSIDTLKLDGPGLIFVTYPVALNKIAGGRIFGALFFLVLFVAGISSSISIVEAFATATLDRFKISRKALVSVLCSVAFLLGLIFCTASGLLALDIVDRFLNRYGLMTVAVLECLIVGWFWGPKTLRAHLDDAAGMRFRGGVGLLMRIVITVVLGITWFGISHQASSPLGATVVRLFLLGGMLLVWLDEHWLDVDIKFVIPGLLVVLLDRAVMTDITTPYEGYPTVALRVLGVGWLGASLVVAFIIDGFFRMRDADGKALQSRD